ncbi:helix-turn-helix domain-containing protein [Streptomyces sp. NBC_00236]|uniref:winged helix-turn-helix transcriptional regulator n=1 Tax=unclassified Streptomyces TaxID=2593676 RepID=UPI002E29DC66|nr:helix-turn-helix domain-containing protein [Streptomyces sp. NBC_00236]
MTHRTVGHAPPPASPPGLPDDRHTQVTTPTPTCPVEITLAALHGRWTTLVVRELLRQEPLNYSDLATCLPTLSDKVLSDRLTQLVSAGVVQKHRTAGWPPTVNYRLTPHGRQLGPVLQALWDWGADAPTQQATPSRPRHDPPDRP